MAGLEPARDFSHMTLNHTRTAKFRHTSIYIYVQMNLNLHEPQMTISSGRRIRTSDLLLGSTGL